MTTVRKVDLVVPLVNEATAMRTTKTAGLVAQGRSGAVSPLSDRDARRGDVDSTINRSARQVPPGIRTSTMATRIGTTPTTSAALAPSAAQPARHHADFSFDGDCNGCKHCYYSCPTGSKVSNYPGADPVLKEPHLRCLFFKAYIRIKVAKKTGCDGKQSPEIIGYEIPHGCPTRMKRTQGDLF